MSTIYFDHNATTPVHPLVREAMLPFLGESFGNPSSSHWAGRPLKEVIRVARAHVAALINADIDEIIFTSGGTEGDNMALKGALMKGGKGAHIVSCAVEHPAVYSTCELLARYGFDVTFVPVDSSGMVDPAEVAKAITDKTVIISIMLANNETGTINPIKDIAAIARAHGVLLHTDAVQAVGKIPIDVRKLGVDMLTGSGHKFNAPKGVGFQYMRAGVDILPLVSGGSQERGFRAGTENVAGIVALGEASRLAVAEMPERHRHVKAVRDRFEKGILDNVPGAIINGHRTERVYNTSNITFKGIEADALLTVLDNEGIACSTGSACSSGSSEPSRVLSAMGLDALCSRGAMRFSFGHSNTQEQVDRVLEILTPIANKLLSMSPYS